jgi:hypothetical protein
MASIIDPAVAKTLIQDYQNRNAAPGGPALKTPDGDYLNGFFIDRACLETIFKSDDNCVGVSINFGKTASIDVSENVITLVFAGVVPATTGITPYNTTGNIYSDPPPCPTFCSNLGA